MEFGGSGFATRWCGLLALVDELRQTSRRLSGDAEFGIFGGYFFGLSWNCQKLKLEVVFCLIVKFL